jgi:hypothetical protein
MRVKRSRICARRRSRSTKGETMPIFAVLYDLETQWPHVVSIRAKIAAPPTDAWVAVEKGADGAYGPVPEERQHER